MVFWKPYAVYPTLLADNDSSDHDGFRLHRQISSFIASEAANIEQWILREEKKKKVSIKND